MARAYRYTAYDASGQRVQGVVQADAADAALAALRAQRLDVVDIQEPREPRGPALRRGRIGVAERVVLLQELGTLLGAGVPLGEAAPSLEAAYAGTPLAQPLARLAREVRNGVPLGQALRRADVGLPAHALSLVDSGEAAGRMSDSLLGAARQLEEERQVMQQFRSALVYPSVLVVAGIAAVLIIFIAVVPRFAGLLKSGRAEIPALSRWVIEGGQSLQAHWPLVLGGAVLLGAAVSAALRSASTRQALLDLMARLPIVGPWLWSGEIGRWAGLTGTLLEHRVPLIDALALGAQASGLSVLRRHLARAQAEVRRGRPLSEVLAEQGWIAATRLNLVRVGERTAELPRLLQELGRLHADAARQAQQRVLALIEPLAIVLIGGVIGVIMAAVVMAVTAMNTARM
ncbi:type II secretion system F family protein [Rubrivivax sp. JA1024]|nr:type II secretion system F family protein [Rubrivivax sp. JA1024]